jgi:TPR repeat protein
MSQPMSLPPELPEARTRPVRFRFGTATKARRGTEELMPKSELLPMKVLVMGLCLSLSCGAASEALAFDPQAGVSKESGPFDLFKFGFFSYKEGRKSDAVEAYRYAAEKGHTGSRWALANMYADGDGVPENDLEAFKMYSEIAQAGVEPGSEDTGYFANALIALASYYRRGIPNSPVKIDLTQARQLYFQAASAFGIPEAQFQLGRMMLTGEGGSVSVHQAKKWLNRARNNGHAGAMGLFGNILFQEGDTARGLAFMTAALEHCQPKDCGWLQSTQEEAFSVASEEDRRKGVELAHNIRFNSGE